MVNYELWMGRTQLELATEYLEIIKSQIVSEIEEKSMAKQLTRLAKVIGLLAILIILILILVSSCYLIEIQPCDF